MEVVHLQNHMTSKPPEAQIWAGPPALVPRHSTKVKSSFFFSQQSSRSFVTFTS